MEINSKKRNKKRKTQAPAAATAVLSCSACMSNRQAFRMVSGPPFCERCMHEVQKLVTKNVTYICSSISRRKDVIFADEPLAALLAKCLFTNNVHEIPRSVADFDDKCNSVSMSLFCKLLVTKSKPNSVIIWAGAGLTMAAGFSPDLSRNAAERSADDYARAFKDVKYSDLKERNNTYHSLKGAINFLISVGIKVFVVTSNVDGFFTDIFKVDEQDCMLLEVHNSVRFLQCSMYGKNCFDDTLYQHGGAHTHCDNCNSDLRVTVSTATDEDDDINLTRHERQVEAFNEFTGTISSKSSISSLLHMVIGVGATNKDSLLQEVLLYQQKSCPFNVKHTSIWMNTESAPTSLVNCHSLCGNIVTVLPKFINSWLNELMENDRLTDMDEETSVSSSSCEKNKGSSASGGGSNSKGNKRKI